MGEFASWSAELQHTACAIQMCDQFAGLSERLAAVMVVVITNPPTLMRAMKVGKLCVNSAISTQVFIAHKKAP